MRVGYVLSLACAIGVLLVACDDDPPDLPGVWDDTTDGNESVTFHADGTWTWHDERRGSTGLPATSSGTWSRANDVVTASGTNLSGQVFTVVCEFLSNGHLSCPNFVESTGPNDHPEEFEKK